MNTVDDSRLERYGENESKLLRTDGLCSAGKIRRALIRNLKTIDGTAARLSEWARTQQSIPQEFEWLLDNRYLCEREGKEACLDLRGGKSIPRDAQTGNPTLYTAVLSLVRATRGGITLERLTAFLNGFQSEKAFTERELSLLVPMLRAALIAMVGRICVKMREVISGYGQDPRFNPFAAERAVLSALSQGSAPPSGAQALAETAKARHAELSETIGSAITSLRFLSGADLGELLMSSSVVERVLSNDPSGHYPVMSEETRMHYRQRISLLARKHGISEPNAAKLCISLAEKSKDNRHVGFYIFREPLGTKPRSSAGFFYFSALFILTAYISSMVFVLTGAWYALLAALLPAFEIAKTLCDFFAVRLKRPEFIPRMDCKEGLPADGAALCVITTVLSRPADGGELAKKLERYYLCNRDAGKRAAFGLLCDLPDSKSPAAPEDGAVLEAAAAAISDLNRRYSVPFFLFARDREFSAGENRYMGHERKRGALTALMRAARGKTGGINVLAGGASRLGDFQFIVTLDSDTRLSAGTLRPLAAAMLHPLNTPVIDAERGVVTQGHAMLQPRMAVDLKSASKNLFTRLFAGQGGLDPYNGNVSDVYQDLFGRGMFVGKGIIHIDAFLRCLDGRLPKNRVLSHDLLEGSYLRAGFIGDIEWSDGFPERVSAWLERAHRWVRGDWQIAAWAGRRVKTQGGREKNPLSMLCRFQISDNLRRSLTPFSLLIILSLACISGGYTLAVLTALAVLALSCRLIISAGQLAARAGANGGQRYHSTIITGAKAAFYQTAAQLWLLPMRALYDIHAVSLALWRLCVSRRHMLSWRTAASSDSRAARTVSSYYRQFFSAALWGAALILTGGAAGIAAGAAWFASPWMAAVISKNSKPKKELTETDRRFLLRHSKLIWDYFLDNVTEADHYLPPDNWQEQPAAGLARRTSPTNIGLGLLSAIAAMDLGLADTETILRFFDKMLSGAEQLQKWNGHLYNWYDTATLQPLRPMCVSTVDSGNFAGYLLTAQAALSELNDAAAQDLAGRAGALYDAMDFRPLYDKRRQLFYIGYDLEINRPTESYYDLLASEARQTSYIAIARGQAPRGHWRRLGRVLSAQNRYSGMVSWTGTMFEYFMPHLIMPVYDNSLLYESLRFAVYCQQKRGEKRGIPWGISESCFFAFDGALNYQYKAHGEPRLAYKRGLGQEQVISPYSSFLALNVSPKKAIYNLKRLESLGLVGRYGFCEAADFTPARVPAKHDFMPVKCYMSHHLGMCLLSIDNLLNDNIMVSRFMSDPEMSAYSELLEEKVPTNGVTMKPRGQEIPEKPARNAVTGWQREFEGIDPTRPRCAMLSNGSYTLFCTDGGLTASTLNGMALTRFEPDALKHGLGWTFFLSGADDFWASLTPLPAPHPHMKYSAVFGTDCVCWKAHGADTGVHTTVTARVPNGEGAEQRSVLLHNSGKTARGFELYSYFEPVLSPMEHYEGHPAFSKLFLQSEIDGGCVKFCRRARGERGDAHIAVACDAPNAKFDTSRELALSRGGASELRHARSEHGTRGSVLDPCALIRVPVTLEPGDSRIITFSMAAAGTASDAVSAAVRTLTLEDDMASSTDTMNLLGLTPAESHAALDWLTDLVFISGARQRQAYDITHNTMGQSGLWQWGISGDIPIVAAMGADAQPERLSRLLRMHRYLSLCGMQFDFVVLTQDGSDYRRPQRAHIAETLKAIGCEGFLGARAGVHTIDAPSLSADEAYLLMSSAALVLDGQQPEPRHDAPAAPVPLPRNVPVINAAPPATRHLGDGSFQFDVNGLLPRAAWGHTLANNAFGALMRDTGFGHVWRQNSRENKLTPWDNDPLAVHGDETMRVIADGRDISPFAGLDGHPCTVTYGFGYAVYQKDIGGGLSVTTTVFVSPDRMARLVKIDVFGAQNARLKHFTRLIMGRSRDDRRYIVTEKTRLSLTARNTRNTSYAPQKTVLSSLPSPAAFTCDANAWIDECVTGQCGAGLEPCFATLTELMPQGEMLSAVVVLGAAQNEKGVALIENLADFGRFGEELERTKAWWRERVCPRYIRTPSPAMNRYLNGWALYQVIANRLFARASFYQCGGAYGFRDQLQDVCAALYTAPRLAKNQILRACAHQFEEGDVQHWWHPARRQERAAGDRGVRTRISDDLLWLPYTVCEYIDKTGDSHILEYSVPYISAAPLADDAHDRFEIPRVTEYRETVLMHCIRAIERVITRGTGANGLLLILGGDWNDGFDRVGAGGRGESTWLTWFAAHVFERFSHFCDSEYAQKLRELSVTLGLAADGMWDGAWYKRGTFDNGAPLGSSQCGECRIDSIAQSFSVFSPQASHSREALNSAYEHLVRGNIIQLFTPPFDKSKQNPGYIKGYLPGVRENGGQYSHASVWLAMAHFIDGQYDRGMELLEKLLPENHGPEYIVEPHVLAADVYSNPEHFGRGGWTHYTGAAAWYYRVAAEYAAKLELENPANPMYNV
ncbi:MAG: hypothetical protein FWH16_03100 [Oscillospiraceae bacterium]|nr:hypothetical protein [Oscillospiraceae bacterium]